MFVLLIPGASACDGLNDLQNDPIFHFRLILQTGIGRPGFGLNDGFERFRYFIAPETLQDLPAIVVGEKKILEQGQD